MLYAEDVGGPGQAPTNARFQDGGQIKIEKNIDHPNASWKPSIISDYPLPLRPSSALPN